MPKSARTAADKGRPGRPSRYQAEYAEWAEKLAKLGATDADLAEAFGVSEVTINNWKKAHPEFSLALKRGKALADAEVADKLFQRATGYSHRAVKILTVGGAVEQVEYTEHYPPDPTSMIFWLKNRRPDLWRDKPEPAQDDGAVAPVRVVVQVKDARVRDEPESEPEQSAG